MSLQTQLNLIFRLDRLIDHLVDENSLLLDILSELSGALRADFGMVALPDERMASREIKAVMDRQGVLAELGEDQVQAVLQGVQAASGNLYTKKIDLNGHSYYAAGLSLQRSDAAPGLLALVRRGRPFAEADLELLRVGSTQIDNALRYLLSQRRLQEETRVLRTVLKIDRIRDTSRNLDELLDRCLSEVCQAANALVGFVMLYDQHGNRLELRASTDRNVQADGESMARITQAADEAVSSGRLVHRAYPDGALRSLLGMPLILNDRVIGVLGVFNCRSGDDFHQIDERLLQAISSQMDTAIFENLQTQQMRLAFGRRVGPHVMERLLQADDQSFLKGDRVIIAALFSDIRGFTAASEKLDPRVTERMINTHLQAMVEVILSNEGTLDKFMGDGVMALFNVPGRQDDFALRAVKTALEMQEAHLGVMEKWRQEGVDPRPIGIGLAVGEAITGNFGSLERAEYTAIGNCVNLAARLCSVARGGQVLLDERIYRRVADQVQARALRPVRLKGFSEPVPNWSVSRLLHTD